jgi:hypothetical protein
MSKKQIKELQERLEYLEGALRSAGISAPPPPAREVEERADYIPFGSDQHAAFLGIMRLGGDEDAAKEIAGERQVYCSPDSGELYCLMDEFEAVRHLPGIDPDKAARVLLRMKVSAFESGVPEVPEGAPTMWTP